MACKEKAEAKRKCNSYSNYEAKKWKRLGGIKWYIYCKRERKRFMGKEDQDIVSLRKDHGQQRRRDHGHQRLAERCSF